MSGSGTDHPCHRQREGGIRNSRGLPSAPPRSILPARLNTSPDIHAFFDDELWHERFDDECLQAGQRLRPKVRELVATQPKIRLDKVSVTTAGGEAKIAVALSTDSMLSLIELQESEAFQELPDAAGNIAGTVVVRLKGLDIDFTRTVKVREALGLASLAIGGEDRASRSLEYIVHLPKAPKESNATSTADGGRTLVWKSSLGDALKKPVVTRFRAALPIPWYAHAAAGLLLAGIVVLILRIRRKRRQRREDACLVDL